MLDARCPHPDRRRSRLRACRTMPRRSPRRWRSRPRRSGSRRTKPAISFSTPGRRDARRRRARRHRRGPIDIVVQPAAERRKRLLVADLESTIIENEMLDELALILGLGPRVAAITRRAMNGEIDFAAALEDRVALLAGVEAGVLDQAAARIRLKSGAAALVATMRRAGAATALVTGGFTIFAERVASALGFDHVVANGLEVADGRLTGKVVPPIVTGAGKRDALRAFAAANGMTPAAGDRGRRRRQRHRDAGGGRARRRLPRQACGRRRRALASRPRRPNRSALRAGLSEGGIRRRLIGQVIDHIVSLAIVVPNRGPGLSCGRDAVLRSADRPGDRPAAGSICARISSPGRPWR